MASFKQNAPYAEIHHSLATLGPENGAMSIRFSPERVRAVSFWHQTARHRQEVTSVAGAERNVERNHMIKNSETVHAEGGAMSATAGSTKLAGGDHAIEAGCLQGTLS